MPDKLIYDRTAADVARVNELMRKVRAGSATDAERAEWLGGGMKGAWNASDLNRINDWLAYLTDFLEAQGYSAAVFLRHTPWTKADFPTRNDIDRNPPQCRGAAKLFLRSAGLARNCVQRYDEF